MLVIKTALARKVTVSSAPVPVPPTVLGAVPPVANLAPGRASKLPRLAPVPVKLTVPTGPVAPPPVIVATKAMADPPADVNVSTSPTV